MIDERGRYSDFREKVNYPSGTSFHEVFDCNKFVSATIGGKLGMMRTGGHCYNCGARNHRAVDCNQDLVQCGMCGGGHQTLLCRNVNETS